MAARSTFTRAAGNVITSALNNSFRDHVVTYTTSNDVATEGQLCVNTSTDQLMIYTGSTARELARYGALTAFTSVILTQGAAQPVSVNTGSGWSRQGPWVDAHFNLTFPLAGVGSAGTQIVITSSDLPVPPAICCAGKFIYRDSGTSFYEGSVWLETTGAMTFVVHGQTAYLGQTPSFSLTAADDIKITLRYAVA